MSGASSGNMYNELNHAAATIAVEAKPEGKFVAGSMGPTGEFLKPMGDYKENQFEAAYAEQASLSLPKPMRGSLLCPQRVRFLTHKDLKIMFASCLG